MKTKTESSVDDAAAQGQMKGVAAVAGGFGDWQAQCGALIADTRKHVALPSDACVMLSLAAQALLARRALFRLDEIRALLDDYEREHLTPRSLTFEGMLLPRIAQLARGQTSSPNARDVPTSGTNGETKLGCQPEAACAAARRCLEATSEGAITEPRPMPLVGTGSMVGLRAESVTTLIERWAKHAGQWKTDASNHRRSKDPAAKISAERCEGRAAIYAACIEDMRAEMASATVRQPEPNPAITCARSATGVSVGSASSS